MFLKILRWLWKGLHSPFKLLEKKGRVACPDGIHEE